MKTFGGLSGAAVVLMLAASQSAPTVGHWQGYMQRGTARLAVTFDFPASSPPRGFFSAPDLGAIDVPVSGLSVGPPVHWALVGDSSTTIFAGTIAADVMSGTFQENARPGTFVLHRASVSTEKPYTREEVMFPNGAVRLSGTVFAPRATGQHPAMIFVHGSGAEGRWAVAYLADYVASHGIVALIYDKRGVGTSTGNWQTASFQDIANDARAGVDLLAHRTDVDRRKIGIYGHSQGAEIAPLIALHNPSVRWIIAADGPIGPQYRQDLFRVDNYLAGNYSRQALADAEKLYAEFVDVARTGASHDQLRADIAHAGNAPWVSDLGIPDDNNWIWGWYKQAGNFDNTAAWGNVPPKESVAQTVAVLKAHGNRRVTVRMFPGADHTLRIPPQSADGWPHNAAGFPEVISEFVSQATL